MISFDIETLGVGSESVVLSVGIVKFSLNSDELLKVHGTVNNVYQQFLKDALFVKFAVSEQTEMLHRKIEMQAIDFWKNQAQSVIDKSFRRLPSDLHVIEGISQIRQFCNGEDAFWARGGLDQIVFESLCRQVGLEPIAEYWCWMDFRTAINLTKDTARKGYCDIPGFDRSQVVKHDPVHDAAYDVMQLMYGK